MSFLACLTLGAVTLGARRLARLAARRPARGHHPGAPQSTGTDIETEAAKAASIARQTSGVAGVEVLSAKENAALLEPWLGTASI